MIRSLLLTACLLCYRGFHARRELSIKLPTPPVDLRGSGAAALLLVIELVDSSGVVLFTEDRVRILVL